MQKPYSVYVDPDVIAERLKRKETGKVPAWMVRMANEKRELMHKYNVKAVNIVTHWAVY